MVPTLMVQDVVLFFVFIKKSLNRIQNLFPIVTKKGVNRFCKNNQECDETRMLFCSNSSCKCTISFEWHGGACSKNSLEFCKINTLL